MSQQQQSSQDTDNNFVTKLGDWIELYFDIVIRGLISFVISIIFVFILSAWLKTSTIVTFVMAFMLSIFISPLFARIKVAKIIMVKYVAFLNKLMSKKDYYA